jgi:hypothetical protein
MGKPEKKVETPKRKYTKKVKPEAPKSVKVLEQQVEELTELLSSSIEGQLESYQMAGEAEEKFRAFAKETERCLNMITYHCKQVQENTGSLTAEDVEYSISLTKRIIEHKFKKA